MAPDIYGELWLKGKLLLTLPQKTELLYPQEPFVFHEFSPPFANADKLILWFSRLTEPLEVTIDGNFNKTVSFESSWEAGRLEEIDLKSPAIATVAIIAGVVVGTGLLIAAARRGKV